MPKISFNVDIKIDDEPVNDPPQPLVFNLNANAVGQPITAEGVANYAKFAGEVAKLYNRALLELIHQRNSSILPEVMKTLYDELTNAASPTARAVASTPGGTLSGEAGLILQGLLGSSRDFTTDLAGTQLGDWNDD